MKDALLTMTKTFAAHARSHGEGDRRERLEPRTLVVQRFASVRTPPKRETPPEAEPSGGAGLTGGGAGKIASLDAGLGLRRVRAWGKPEQA